MKCYDNRLAERAAAPTAPQWPEADWMDALYRAEKTMKERAYADYERYNPLDYDKCLTWVEATMREVRKELESLKEK